MATVDSSEESTAETCSRGVTKEIGVNDFKKGRNFTIMSLNARSINNKFKQLRDTMHTIDPGVLCIQETWGKNDSTDYSITGYHPPIFQVRKSKNMSVGGGVAIWIREDTNFTQIKSPFIEKEIDPLAIRIPSHNLILINVYQGFGDVKKAVENLSSFIDGLVETNKKSDLMIVGDFNVDLAAVTTKSELLIQEMAARNLNQLITKPTRVTSTTSTIIDHVYLKSTKKTAHINGSIGHLRPLHRSNSFSS